MDSIKCFSVKNILAKTNKQTNKHKHNITTHTHTHTHTQMRKDNPNVSRKVKHYQTNNTNQPKSHFFVFFVCFDTHGRTQNKEIKTEKT